MAAEQLLKRFKDFIQTADVVRERSWFSLGPLSVNLAVGDVRGVESGRLIQIVGKQSSGKTTLALDIARQYQSQYQAPVVYVDFERSFDPEYARSCGIDLRTLYLVKPDTTEQGFTIVEEAVKEGFKLVIIDSIAAAMPSSEQGKDYDDSPKMASNAGLITRFCNRIVPLLDNNDALVVVLNQTRANFSTLSQEKEIPFGGLALQFAISVTLHTSKIKTEDTKQRTQVLVKKNKTKHLTIGRAEFTINYGQGIDHARDVIELAIEKGIVRKSGAWFSYNDIKIQGLDRANELPIEEIKEMIIHG